MYGNRPIILIVVLFSILCILLSLMDIKYTMHEILYYLKLIENHSKNNNYYKDLSKLIIQKYQTYDNVVH